MKTKLIAILVLVSLAVICSPKLVATSYALNSPQFSPSQVADLQFTEDMVFVSVEQGGSNTTVLRVHNYGGNAGSANITFLGSEPDGITVDLSTTIILNLVGGTYQDIIANVSAEADLWPLGPRRLDLGLVNGTTGLDSIGLEMNVIAPTTTSSGIMGIPTETIVLSLIATGIVVVVIVIARRR